MVQGNETRAKILQFIENYTRQYSCCPTVREIGNAVGLKSTSTVHRHIQRMKRDGVLTSVPMLPRTVQVKREAPFRVYYMRTNLFVKKCAKTARSITTNNV